MIPSYFNLTLKEFLKKNPNQITQEKIFTLVKDMGDFVVTDEEIVRYELNIPYPYIKNDRKIGMYIEFNFNAKLKNIFLERYVFLKYFEIVYGQKCHDSIQYQIDRLTATIVSRLFPKREVKKIGEINDKSISPENPFLLKFLETQGQHVNNKADVVFWENSLLANDTYDYCEPYRFSEILATVKADIMKNSNRLTMKQLHLNYKKIKQSLQLENKTKQYWIDRISETLEQMYQY